MRFFLSSLASTARIIWLYIYPARKASVHQDLAAKNNFEVFPLPIPCYKLYIWRAFRCCCGRLSSRSKGQLKSSNLLLEESL